MSEQDILHKVIRNTVFNIIGRFWNVLITFFLTPYIIKHIGIERYGVFALVGVLTGYFGLLDLGVGYSFVKYIAEFYAKKDYNKINKVTNTGFAFYSIFAVIIIVLAFLNIKILLAIFKIPAPLQKEVSFVFLLAVVIFGLLNVFSSFFAIQKGLQRLDVTNKIEIAISIPKFLGTIFFLKNGLGLPGLMINNAIVFLIASIINFAAVFKLLPQLKFNPFLSSWQTFKTLFGFGFKIQISRFAGLFHFQMDKFLLAYFLNVSLVAFYSIASEVASRLMELPMMLITVIQPAASELDAKSEKKGLVELYYRSMKYVVLLALPATLLTILLAKPFISLWLGKGYEKAILTLQLLVIAYFINVLTGPGFCILNGIGKPEYAMRSSILAMVLNALLSIILVIKIGYFGVVFGTISALTIAAIYFLFLFYKVSHIPFLNSLTQVFLKPLTLGLIPFLFGLMFINNFSQFNWLGLITFSLLYLVLFFVLMLIVKYIDNYDKDLLKKIVGLEIFK
ncbi:MAG: flippase [Candidatus Omnitrophota bacterium]|nr:flippase [Candidatus Omnitrophota bacterium]